MNLNSITVETTLQPDGVTLQLEKKLGIPPGRVVLTVQPTVPQPGPTMLEVLERIHRDQKARGRRQMQEEEMATEIARMQPDDLVYLDAMICI